MSNDMPEVVKIGKTETQLRGDKYYVETNMLESLGLPKYISEERVIQDLFKALETEDAKHKQDMLDLVDEFVAEMAKRGDGNAVAAADSIRKRLEDE